MSTMTLGTDLTPQDQRAVLSAYIHRYTGDHKPAWVTWEPLQFKDDEDWLANTKFHTRLDGHLDGRFHYCESTPTWPNNPELRR